MHKKLFLLGILLAFAVGLALPASSAAADGANQVYFTATSEELCPITQDARCSTGTFTPLPNGKGFLTGWVAVVQFTATDPRWTAECVFRGDPFPPGNVNAFPIMGSFVCTPTDPALAGGWWEGTASHVLQGTKGRFISEWRAKGYGTFDGLLSMGKHTVTNTSTVVIVELPGYQK